MFPRNSHKRMAVGVAGFSLLLVVGCGLKPKSNPQDTRPVDTVAVRADKEKIEPAKKEPTKKDMLVGSWFPVKEPDDGIEFKEDGKLNITYARRKETLEGTYALDGDKLTINMKRGEKEEKESATVKKLTQTDLHIEFKMHVAKFDPQTKKFVEKEEGSEIQEFKRDSERAKVKADRLAAQNSPEGLMKSLGIAYHSYFSATNKAPSKAEDLAPYVENDPRILNPLKSGEWVFIYNVGIFDMIEGTSNTVLAYTKETPTKGGTVLMGDGLVVKMTAEQFKKARLAKPKGK